jgi:hypothetical protein
MRRLGFGAALIVASLSSEAAGQLPCRSGYALDFSGGPCRVLVPYDSSFPTAVFSVTAWVRTPVGANRTTILARGEDAVNGNAAWNLYMQPDGEFTLRIEDITDADFSYGSGVLIGDDAWHHVAATRSATGTVNMYVDGQLAASHSSTGVPSSANQQFLTMGCTNGTFGPPSPTNPVHPLWFFPGWIAEPAMWGVALSGAQVLEVFERGVDPGSPGLAGLWRLDEGRGQVVSDSSPAGNDGYRGALPFADGADPAWVSMPPEFSNYCIALPNSTGTTASIGISGSLSVTANTFTLLAQGAVPHQFALFFYGPQQTQLPLGDGFRCIGAGGVGVFRLGPPQQVAADGSLTRVVDFHAAPMNSGGGMVEPGSNWNFQMWHRDTTTGGGAGSNLTDAVSVTFCH